MNSRPVHLVPVLVSAVLLLGACAHSSSSPSAAAKSGLARPPASVWWADGIKLGRCAQIPEMAETKAAGFDYLELNVRPVASLSDEDFEKAFAEHRAAGLPTPVGNGFLPSDLKVVGPDVDPARQMAYVQTAFDRMARLGMKIIVFGSGDARRIPEGFPHEKAFEQLVDFAKRIAPEAAKRDITLAVEALRQKEDNSINTTAEAFRWVKAVDHPNFQLMVDFFHMSSEKEDADILLEAKDHIVHFHFANPNNRVYPKDPAEYDYAKFFANLKKIGFRGGISLEVARKNSPPFAEAAPSALAFLRQQVN